eukprot:g47920.t1
MARNCRSGNADEPALRQREAEFKAEMDKLRKENNELRTTKRHKNDGSFGQAAAALKNRLDEDEETQPELGAPGLRSAWQMTRRIGQQY